jgi:hypothetical protein
MRARNLPVALALLIAALGGCGKPEFKGADWKLTALDSRQKVLGEQVSVYKSPKALQRALSEYCAVTGAARVIANSLESKLVFERDCKIAKQ